MLPDLFTSAQWDALARHFGLSAGERNVARLICRGCSDREVAETMHVSAETVETHVSQLFQKLEIETRVGIPVRLMLAGRRIGCAGAWNR